MASSNSEIRALERTMSTLLNKQLQQICATNGLRTSGVKAELQNRIKTALLENYQADPVAYAHLRNTIDNSRTKGASSSSSNAPNAAMPSASNHSHSNGYGHSSGTRNTYPYHSSSSHGQSSSLLAGGYNNYDSGVSNYGGDAQSSSSLPADLSFKSSPFYKIERRIGSIKTCEAMSQHRASVSVTLKVNDLPVLQRCLHERPMRVMVFCVTELQGLQDISFPHQSEIKVNNEEVKANLRGLKGKPGSTKPVDITSYLRLKQSNYVNNIEFTYALTTKVKKTRPQQRERYYLGIFLCKTVPVDDLVSKIKGKRIPAQSVIQEISKAANDPDVVATSQVLSLKCPLSYTRLRNPCRSTHCSHIQCFDATSYLQLQEQGPQWLCPICNKSAPFDHLAVDEYVRDILQNTSESQDQVTIEPNGEWRKEATEREPKRPRYSTQSAKIEDDDDISIVSDPRTFKIDNIVPKVENPYATPSQSLFNPATPNSTATGSREPSSVPRSSSSKRPAEVIDLTLSSDEDEPPARPPKRQNTAGLGDTIRFPDFPY